MQDDAPRTRRASAPTAILACALLALAGCGPGGEGGGGQPGAAAPPPPPAAQALARMSAAAQRGAWDAVVAEQVPACEGAADKPCAEAQALRARACRRLAATAPEAARAGYRDCAVQAGQAALAAGGANTQAERNAWRAELLQALFDRRAVTPRAGICPDNDLMRAEADRLLRDSPGNAVARFHAGNARMLGVSVSCGAEDQRCADLAEAARLLTPPQADPRWMQTLEGVRTLQRVVVGCPEG
ncbi:hypothetical protein FHS88_000305 [Roseomonas alkaliterrae]|uniref:Secreted protein n=2 Tax=Neoroseomonas alkaliterrae TaxID=1452450 RepID=A0A840XI61_9PROT|nr:hypothetical protein [Neoroseomonas alkaliterrae]MBB5688195.1 hypothetical protein [Neoroseomonas alkaliterrae]